jgi:hypothetical protein
MQTSDGVYGAETDDEKAAIYRQRYDIYVLEMDRYRDIADHDRCWLKEPVDDVSRLFYAVRGGELVGSIRLTLGADAPLADDLVEKYGLAPFLAELPHDGLIISERFMVNKEWRGTDVLFSMIVAYVNLVNELRIQLMIGDCEPHLLNLYQALGFRPYAARNINSPAAGYLIPLVIVAEDIDYVRGLKSPLADVMKDFGGDKRIPACVETLINQPTGVTSERLVEIADYWQNVYSSLEDLEAHRVSLFDGLSEEQAQMCLAKSTIIDCAPGDRILKLGNTAQNLFLMLDGVAEVRDGGEFIAAILPGEVFGEIAFLLGRPRTADVFAAAPGTRILSLSETVMRKMIEDQPEAAAKLMVNVSKMLCWRLVRDG